MFAALTYEYGLGQIKWELSELLNRLGALGFEYVVFDTPAEFKDLTLCATSLTLLGDGTNVFVSTVFGPALWPLIETLPMYYSRADNYILINRVRKLDRELVADRAAVLDFLSAGQPCAFNFGAPFSEPFLDVMLHVKESNPVYWRDSLEGFMSAGSQNGSPIPAWDSLAESLREDLSSLVDFIVAKRSERF